MADININSGIADRSEVWEGWLAKISDKEMTRILQPLGYSSPPTIPDQVSYDEALTAVQNYYKKMR